MAPFRYDTPENRFGATIAEMLMHQGDSAARSAETIAAIQAQAQGRSAEAWGNAIQHIGQTVGTALDPVRRQTLQLRQNEQQLEAQRLGMQNQQMQAGLDEKERSKQARMAVASAMSDTPMNVDGTYDLDAIAKKVPREFATDVEPHLKQLASINQSLDGENQRRRTEATRVAAQIDASDAWKDPVTMDAFIATLSNNSLITSDQRDAFRQRLRADPTAGQQIVRQFIGPQKLEKVGVNDRLINARGDVVVDAVKPPPKTSVINGQLLNNETGAHIGEPVPPQVTPAQEEAARHNKELERIAGLTAGRAEASAAETARHDRAMEESARNRVQARPMLSGDANRVANLDTSLSQLTALRGEAKNTGAVSGIESAMPNFVTEFTGGIGAGAKARNAQIALVRQIIGKALEGGVLRKEDEIKYKAILPTISDAPDVAAKKLDGLETLLKEKRMNILEALGDAGFNVDKMTARTPQPAAPRAKIRARDPQGKLHEADAGTPLPAGWKLE